MINLEEKLKEAKIDIILQAHKKLKVTEEYQNRNKMGRLYMMCLELNTSHVTLMPILKQINLEL